MTFGNAFETCKSLFPILDECGCDKVLNYVFSFDASSRSEPIRSSFASIGGHCHVFKQPKSYYFLNDPRNPNHFRISEYWDAIIPKMTADCGFTVDSSDFELVSQKDDRYGYDLSYHEPKCEFKFSMEPLSEGAERADGTHRHVFREGSGMSMYHRLCRNTHFSYDLRSDKGERTCAVLCDSMAAPVIPIVACYFKRMVVFDVCHGATLTCDVENVIKDARPDTFLSINTEIHFQ